MKVKDMNISKWVRLYNNNLRIVSASWDKRIRIWDSQTGKQLEEFTGA